MDLNNLTKQEIKIMIGGLESRNRHNIDVINGRKTVPKGMIQVCMDECNKIENLTAKLENILRQDDKEEQINTKEFEESLEKFKKVFNEMINRIKIATDKIKESNIKRNQGGVIMSKVVSLVDTDVVIVQSRCRMDDNEIKEQEEKLTEKLGKKVVIIPPGFDVIECGTVKQDIKELKDGSSVPTVEVKLELDTYEVEQFVKEQIDSIKAGMETVIAKIAEPKYKVLNKEDYIKPKIDKAMKRYEEQWERLSKGGKYIIYTEDGDKNIHYYSLDYFYNKPILSCNISK